YPLNAHEDELHGKWKGKFLNVLNTDVVCNAEQLTSLEKCSIFLEMPKLREFVSAKIIENTNKIQNGENNVNASHIDEEIRKLVLTAKRVNVINETTISDIKHDVI